MFERYSIKKVHANFLESCRNLKEGRDYWRQANPIKRWLLERIIRVPLLSIQEDGKRLYNALQWLEQNCRHQELTVDTLRQYHHLLFDKQVDSGGCLRQKAVGGYGTSTQYPAAERIPVLLRQLFMKYQGASETETPVNPPDVLEMSVRLYQRIGWIHPFIDGNGRVARLAMNHWMRRHGQEYIILPPISEDPSLLSALNKADRGNFRDLLAMAASHSFKV